VLVSTPIGNLGDLTPRAREALRTAEVILCEDTRRTARLLLAIGAKVKLQPLHEHNEDNAISAVLAQLRQGRRVALVSDAGVPLVSDPGYRLVRAALAAGMPVNAVPGANAAVTALVLSGLPPVPFLMLGFTPPRQAGRQAAFARIRAAERAGLSATLVWYEAPHRLADSLAAMAAAFGARPAAVARELTKQFEEVRRALLPELAAHYRSNEARGEFTVVVGPPEHDDPEDLDGRLRDALADNTVKDAAALVATATGLPRKLVYARALALRRG
jgi:16S rRNA (cytidine1402-2'-O)-methyltransferase